MHNTRIIITLILLCSNCLCYAQSNSFDDVLDMIKIYLQEDDKADIQLNENIDEILYDIHQNPINLNTATREQLEQLPFLSDIHIENILFYIYITKEIKSIYELQLIEDLPDHVTRFLLPFVTILPIEHRTDWKREFHNIRHRASISAGYKLPHDSLEIEGGIPIKSQLRYKLQAGRVFTAGITTDHDAGEQFYGNAARGFDHYKMYAELRPIGSVVKSATIGSFRASYGQGLVLGDISYGSPLDEISRSTTHSRETRHYAGSDEYRYFNGAAVDLQFGKWKLSSFYSYRLHDADTTNGTFSTIDESGYHRNWNESKKRNTLPVHTACIHSSYLGKAYEIGITTLFNHHSLEKVIPNKPYYLHKFSGKNQFGASVNYRWKWKKVGMYGEWAINQSGGVACINTINISPSYGTSILINHRYYSPKYDMMYANPYASTSNGTNEHGGTLGLIHQLKNHWQISSYIDIYQEQWLKYSTNKPSLNGTMRVDAKYNDWGRMSAHIYAKYRYYEDLEVCDKLSRTATKHQISAKGVFRYNLNFLKMSSGANCAYNITDNTYSYSFVQDIGCSVINNRLDLHAMFTVFNADDWGNRLYWYEKNLPYTGFSQALFGKGARWLFLAKGMPCDELNIYLRIAQTIIIEDRQTTPITDFNLMFSIKL